MLLEIGKIYSVSADGQRLSWHSVAERTIHPRVDDLMMLLEVSVTPTKQLQHNSTYHDRVVWLFRLKLKFLIGDRILSTWIDFADPLKFSNFPIPSDHYNGWYLSKYKEKEVIDYFSNSYRFSKLFVEACPNKPV